MYVCTLASIILAENSNTIPILHLLAKFSSCTLLKFVTYWSVRKFQLCAAAVQRSYRPFFPHSLGISNQGYSTTMATVLEPEERIESVTVDGLVSSVYLDRMLRIWSWIIFFVRYAPASAFAHLCLIFVCRRLLSPPYAWYISRCLYRNRLIHVARENFELTHHSPQSCCCCRLCSKSWNTARRHISFWFPEHVHKICWLERPACVREQDPSVWGRGITRVVT